MARAVLPALFGAESQHGEGLVATMQVWVVLGHTLIELTGIAVSVAGGAPQNVLHIAGNNGIGSPVLPVERNQVRLELWIVTLPEAGVANGPAFGGSASLAAQAIRKVKPEVSEDGPENEPNNKQRERLLHLIAVHVNRSRRLFIA